MKVWSYCSILVNMKEVRTGWWSGRRWKGCGLKVCDLLDLTIKWALLQLKPMVLAARQMYIPPSASVTWWITNLFRYAPSDPLPISLDFRMMKGCLLITMVLLDINLGSSTLFSHCKKTEKNIIIDPPSYTRHLLFLYQPFTN